MNPSPHPSSVLCPPSTDVTKEGVVGVFWDYESCPRPQEYAGSTVVQCIQNVALESGSIGVFNVYVDLETHRTSPRMAAGLEAKGLREEFHSLGVSVLDCPGKSTKAAADKMIIVDLFAFALVNRRLATMVVISADPDLAYTLSLLRQRHCKVILISKPFGSRDIGAALGSQADVLLTWEVLLKGQERLPPSSTQDTSTQTVMSANRPAIRLTRSGSAVSPTIPNNLSPATASGQPTTSSTPTAASRIASIPGHLRRMIALLATARKSRGWHEPYIQDRMRAKLGISMDDQYVYIT
ncbi:hypothetical protein FRC04_005422 [Tulasnella sp. 424]|nr:hypothetical protein FRC04_005422 [Tulasnella sp. 424]KAG8962596.1 hypothetical protein FRC05_005275 [Tulasnella sp. 425]